MAVFLDKSGRKLPANLRGTSRGSTLKITAAADGSKRFTIRAYSGGPLYLADYPLPVIVDLAGMEIESQTIPTPFNHDLQNEVGRTESITKIAAGMDGTTFVAIDATGVLDTATDDGRLVAAANTGGFKWEASIGAPVQEMEEYGKGETVRVNGRTFSGPVLVARKTTLKEISFVRRGADVGGTHIKIAAKGKKRKAKAMDFESWIIARGSNPADLSPAILATLRAAHAAEMGVVAEGDPAPDDEKFKEWLKGKGGDPDTMADELKATLRAAFDAESAGDEEDEDEEDEMPTVTATQVRAALNSAFRKQKLTWEIEAACKDHPEIKAQAIGTNGIRKGWDMRRVANEIELKTLRASRATGGQWIATGGREKTDRFQVIQAALYQTAKLAGHEKMFPDQVLQAAHTAYRGRLGLKQMILEAAFSNGYQGNIGSLTSDHAGVLRAAFSTVSLPGLMSNVANKFLLEGFMAVEQTWRDVTAIRSVADFKTITSYRMLGDDIYEKVGPAGELKHGTVDEESFTNAAETYGKMFAITRRDQINDDLGALTDKPRRIGRGGALKLNDVFWTEFCDNSTFFADPSAHFYKGADSVLASAGLAKVLAKFRAKVDAEGYPLSIEPRILLVPTALEVTAEELMTAQSINTGGSSSTDKVPNVNVWRSKYQVRQSAYLDNASYGNSSVIWYLLANPGDVAVIETCFLNGQESPTVEQADADFNTLGIQMRGYFDFGVNKQDARGGVKSKGAA